MFHPMDAKAILDLPKSCPAKRVSLVWYQTLSIHARSACKNQKALFICLKIVLQPGAFGFQSWVSELKALFDVNPLMLLGSFLLRIQK